MSLWLEPDCQFMMMELGRGSNQLMRAMKKDPFFLLDLEKRSRQQLMQV